MLVTLFHCTESTWNFLMCFPCHFCMPCVVNCVPSMWSGHGSWKTGPFVYPPFHPVWILCASVLCGCCVVPKWICSMGARAVEVERVTLISSFHPFTTTTVSSLALILPLKPSIPFQSLLEIHSSFPTATTGISLDSSTCFEESANCQFYCISSNVG